MDNRFKFTPEEQELIKEHVAEVEADYGEGEMSLLQHFENDTLGTLVDRLPEELLVDELDLDFLNRPLE